MNCSTPPELKVVYRIDGNDCVCEVGADWVPFAEANDGAEVLPERVLGRPLWDFIKGVHIRELYRQMVRRARSGHPAAFDYRCDAPEWRRRFRMTIRAADDNAVEFFSELRWQEKRTRMDVLDSNVSRGESWVRVCSWCQNVAITDGKWVPVEEAVVQLGLMATETLPSLTHGICPSCHLAMLVQLESAAAAPDPTLKGKFHF